MYLYMVVTNDKYELPLIVSEDIHDIEWFTDRAESSIRTMMSRFDHGKSKKCRYKKIKVDDDEVKEWQMLNG